MSLSNSAENNLMLLLFNNTDWANIGDVTGLRGSIVPGSFFISLHLADPDEGGDQTTNEATFGAYARIPVARSALGFTVTGAVAANTALVTFAVCSGGLESVTHFGVGRDLAGAGELVASAALNAPRLISPGITPEFKIGQLTITAD